MILLLGYCLASVPFDCTCVRKMCFMRGQFLCPFVSFQPILCDSMQGGVIRCVCIACLAAGRIFFCIVLYLLLCL